MQAETDQAPEESGNPFDPNTPFNTLLVALALCLVCSLVVSTAAVTLRPLQEQNRANKMKRNVLIAAGIWDPAEHADRDIPELFENIDVVLVNLFHPDPATPEPGTLNRDIDPETVDFFRAPRDPADIQEIPRAHDLASIKRRARYGPAYLVRGEEGALETIVLPIYGRGLWSTLMGFLALDSDTRTIKGITFFEHAETPGLGGEVDNPRWRALWPGAIALDEEGNPILTVTRPDAAERPHEIDGLAGATITARGVQHMVRYWLGENAFGPFLERVRAGELEP